MKTLSNAGLGTRPRAPLRIRAIRAAVDRLGVKPNAQVRDGIGRYATDFGAFYLVAKTRLHLVQGEGGIVSVQAELVAKAHDKEKDIVIYLGESGKFYKFNPAEIYENCSRNEREGIGMLNFNINLGENMEGDA